MARVRRQVGTREALSLYEGIVFSEAHPHKGTWQQIFENEQPLHQDYLMENGIWKLRHFLRDGHAEINGQCPEYLLKYQEEVRRKRFARLRYDSMEQVIAEVLNAYQIGRASCRERV